MVDFDLENMSDDELYDLVGRAEGILGKRQTSEVFDNELNEVLSRGVAAGLIEDKGHGEAWVQPQGGHDMYLKGAVVEHNGRTWRSRIPNNVWEPGNTSDPQAWRWWEDITDEVAEDDDAPGEDETIEEEETQGLPPWDGEGHQYITGDQFDHEGTPYRVLQDHQSQPHYTPDIVPALYEPGTYAG